MIQTIKKLFPEPVNRRLSKIYYRTKAFIAEKNFDKTPVEPAYLNSNHLAGYDKKFPHEDTMLYDFESMMERAVERKDQIVNGAESLNLQLGNKVLEIGCGDGLISALLNEKGYHCNAIDIATDLFNEYTKNTGVIYNEMDAANLKFENENFDFIFSYNSFEHFQDPKKVFMECMRVLKPQGIMFFQFNPLYYSPFGFHAYKSIGIPYCHVLFSLHDLQKFADANGRNKLNTDFLNKETIDYFRKLFTGNYKNEIKIAEYSEEENLYFVDFIRKYPSCFKKENVSFDNFITSGIKTWIKKK